MSFNNKGIHIIMDRRYNKNLMGSQVFLYIWKLWKNTVRALERIREATPNTKQELYGHLPRTNYLIKMN